MAPGILRLDKFAFDYIHNEPSGSASSRGTVQNDCFDSWSITSSDSSKVILTPTSSSSPSPPATGTPQHKENIWAVPPATNKASQRPRSLSLPASPITDLADITNILHSPVKPPKRLEVSQCPTVELFSPIPRDSKIFCHAPPLGPWILKTYWHVETYPASSSLVIIQAGLSAAGATQGLVIEIDKALRSLNLPARPKSWIQSFIPFQFSSMPTSPKPFNNTIERINLYLLRCASLLACDQPGMGLKDADEALRIAEAENVYFMRSKSHLYRGLCFRKMARWVEASSAFTQAASIKAWAGRVRELKSEAEDNIARSRNIMPKRVRFAD